MCGNDMFILAESADCSGYTLIDSQVLCPYRLTAVRGKLSFHSLPREYTIYVYPRAVCMAWRRVAKSAPSKLCPSCRSHEHTHRYPHEKHLAAEGIRGATPVQVLNRLPAMNGLVCGPVL